MVFLYFFTLLALIGATSVGMVSLVLGTSFRFSLMVDHSSIVFTLTLFMISISVLIWAYYYMDTEVIYRNFVCLVFCFLFAMYGLVLSGSLLTLLVFWDLLGFTSFFLVVFYRNRVSLAGGILTGLRNRIGDALLLLLFGLCYLSSVSTLGVFKFLIAVAAMTKSAQLPFSAWLPAAMCAPTPVSALVHSSTLVTAGVYLIYRFTPRLSCVLMFIGLLTALLSAWAASAEWMLKKVVALSTLSQLGFILTALGLGSRSLAFMHINTHACFKALLFMAVGVACHSNYGSQSLRVVGTTISASTLVGTSYLVSSLSMCGLFFLSGWCSKEIILERFTNAGVSGPFVLMLWVRVVLTVFYSLHLVGQGISSKRFFLAATEYRSLVSAQRLPLFFLLSLSIGQGWVFDLARVTRAPVLHSLLSLNTFFNMCFGFLLSVGLYLLLYEEPPTFISLVHCTSYFSRSSSFAGHLGLTEVKRFHGVGLASSVGLVQSGTRTRLYLLKHSLLLSLFFLFL